MNLAGGCEGRILGKLEGKLGWSIIKICSMYMEFLKNKLKCYLKARMISRTIDNITLYISKG